MTGHCLDHMLNGATDQVNQQTTLHMTPFLCSMAIADPTLVTV